MDGISSEALEKHRRYRLRRRRLIMIFPIIAVTVAILVFWWLKLIGITITGDVFCGLDEHTHTEECYSIEYVCEAEAADNTETETSQEEGPSEETTHIHTEECETRLLVCTTPEHTHSSECFPDPNADIETVGDWLKTLEDTEITNDIRKNLIAVALTQKGYTESSRNYEFDEYGNKRGYTRYGEWYGNPYCQWNTAFVSFCLHYSNINNVSELEAAGAEAMRLAWDERLIYAPSDSYSPSRGDVVFLDNDEDGVCDTTGIVLSTYKTEVTDTENTILLTDETELSDTMDSLSPTGETGLILIAGDINDSVEIILTDGYKSVIGYGLTGELSFAKDTEYDKSPEQSEVLEPEAFSSPAPVLMFSTGVPQPNITYIEDLTLALAAVHFKTEDGEVLDDGSTVYVGQQYIVSLEFKEDNTGDDWIQFQHNEAHILHYQIPEYLHCEPFDSWHPITALTENGTVENVGEYYVDEHGYLRVRFHDDENGVCFGSKYSNVDFVIDFTATVGESLSGSTTEIEFGNQISVNLNVDGGADMTVTKTHGEYDNDNNTMEYTIRVEATQGVVKDLVIDDQIWENHYTLRDTITVTDLDGNVLDPQPVISNHPSHNNGADKGFRISGFPDFSAGNGFLITYKTQVFDYMLSGETVDMWNGIDALGKDSNGNDVYVWADDWLRVELEKIEKEGKQSSLTDANGNQIPVIEWEVEIKKDNHNLQGTVIIDTLGEGLSYYTENDIRIKCYDEWGNRLPDVYVSWDDVTVNGNSMSFALPDGYAFDIIYYTEYEELAEGEKKNYTNSVSAVINGKQETAGGDADVIGFIPYVTKSAEGTDGEYVYFTIEADVPAVIKDWGYFYFTDLAAFWGYSNDVGYLYAENSPQDLTITAVTDSGRVIEFTPHVPGGPIENTYMLIYPAEGDQYHSFNVLFNTSEADFSTSKWIENEGARLTVTYKLPFDAKTGTEWEGELSGEKSVEDVLLEGYSFANEVYFNYTDVIQGTASTNYEYSPVITKDSVINEDGTIDYTVVFHNTIPGSYGDQGYLNVATSMAYFTDTFNEKLEYVSGSLKVTCYDPWRDGLWMNKYEYSGQISENNMSVPANQFTFVETNPDAAAVGWNNLYKRASLDEFYKWVNAGGDYVFTYTLKIKDEYLNSTEQNILQLDNTAEITWDNNGSSGPVTEEIEFKTGLLDKQVVQENNRLKFDIHVNNKALDILPGTDKLTIEDTMSADLSVYWDTIKLYYETADGSWVDFDSTESVHKYTVTYDAVNNKLTFVIPDSLHIRIDYTTLITQSGQVSVSNSVKIDGKAQVSDIIDAIFRVEEHSGGASGSTNKITLLKQDGETNASLSGVTFRLYGPMGDPHAVLPEGADSSILSEKNKNLYYIGSYTTGADGTVIIDTQYLTNGGPYALVEAAPPEGYLPLQKPSYFYFYEPDPDGIIQTVTTIVTVENYTYDFVFPETGGTGTFFTAIIGSAFTAFPILYSIIRRKRERRLTISPGK